jgi:hypothetical protein
MRDCLERDEVRVKLCKISSYIASSREATAHEPHMVGLVDSQPSGAARVMKDGSMGADVVD